MFIPGETITHQFFIPFVRSDVNKVEVTYRQNGHIILRKSVAGGSLTNVTQTSQSSFNVTLSQQESLLFDDDKPFYVQLNVIFMNNTRCASVEIKGSNGMQHIREVVYKNG